ncbi:family 43 glycosylhydrolase [Gracilibacillus oryzae]|uniref:Family 43 glycosylhydrolase n=1 Tax=Gracilibacillus oryzae TaxID=1672701 RepID=A0A7C8KZU7_9BACI|nr:arabinan endo-1,5-alpha-L-arabinosidase [Gracilibacillus oryzae]KAB8137612.1 family 43 glycosylhydrolase [Gracilibacillus oryzae]
MMNQSSIPIDKLYDETVLDYKEKWTVNNVHDPAIIKDGDWYYVFSTDAQFKGDFCSGIQIRKSNDLINWEWVGYAFENGVPAEAESWTGAKGLWAPEIVKFNQKYYMYYAASQFGKTQSFIGVATSENIEGPFEDQGLVYKSVQDEEGPNAIDPNITIDKDGEPWMVYGSFFGGIYLAKINKQTGKLLDEGRGKLIAQRNRSVDRALEGPYIVYHPDFEYYYLFVSYDSLFSNYNIRVARSKSMEGPYLDFSGNEMTDIDSPPYEVGMKLLGGYKFHNSDGWVAPGHNTVLNDDNNFYICHHIRAPKDKRWHYLHIRTILWTEDGWPLISPQRFAGEEKRRITAEELTGDWELFKVDQHNDEQDESFRITVKESNWINKSNNNYHFIFGENRVSGVVNESWDWENWTETIVFMGKDQEGTVYLGKRTNSY